jgi:RNA polymerase sigma-70 factor (ECF subfamily)
VLYLLFNEGYSAHQGESLLRADLCDESIRLARLLAAYPASGLPKTHALLALLLLHASRLPARVNAEGDELTSYHLQAGIAAQHALAPSYNATDWENITEQYDLLYQMDPSPVIAFNRPSRSRAGRAPKLAWPRSLKSSITPRWRITIGRILQIGSGVCMQRARTPPAPKTPLTKRIM